MVNKSSSFGSTVSTFFAGALGAMGGYFVFMICVGLFTLIFGGCGVYLLTAYNKKEPDGQETPLFKNMTTVQYIGCVLIAIACIPYLGFFFQSMAFSGGYDSGNMLMNQFQMWN